MMIQETVEKQKAFSDAGFTNKISSRKASLHILRNTINEHIDDIRKAILDDQGSSPSIDGPEFVIEEIETIKKNLKFWAWKERRSCERYGNVLIMASHDNAFAECMLSAVYAIAAGNTVIIKPSQHTPNISAIVKTLVEETFTEDYVAVFEGDQNVNNELLSQSFDYICFSTNKVSGLSGYKAFSQCGSIVPKERRLKFSNIFLP